MAKFSAEDDNLIRKTGRHEPVTDEDLQREYGVNDSGEYYIDHGDGTGHYSDSPEGD